MDCTMLGHHVRTFCSAIWSMTKISRDIYFEYDPLEGLILRSLNDAKSAFCAFSWKPTFFDRCTSPPTRKRLKDDHVFRCRAPARAMVPIIKPRKGVVSLRIRNEITSDQMYLIFEFHLEKNNNNLLNVIHRIGIVEAEGMDAIKDREGASEIVAMPRFLLRMMDPLKKAAEFALVINNEAKILTMASFHHESHHDNALLQAKSATLLKSETSAAALEFEVFSFRKQSDGDATNDAPKNVDKEVTLVCTLREPKAILSFCSSATDDDLRVSMMFHWGGKPLVFEAKTHLYSVELVMATLDHKLLQDSSTTQG